MSSDEAVPVRIWQQPDGVVAIEAAEGATLRLPPLVGGPDYGDRLTLHLHIVEFRSDYRLPIDHKEES